MERMPDYKDIALLRKKLLSWYRKHKRNYPWRETGDPFKILIAEIMLRRTKADQVRPIYEQLMAEFPDIGSLAKADIRSLKRIMYPIGLTQRANTISLVVSVIKDKYGSLVPKTRRELITLPGIGDYSAGAVLSLAYNKNEVMVDSNVVRLFTRYFGIKPSKRGYQDANIIKIARLLASSKAPSKANLALLDFAALICTPRNPRCTQCPLNKTCSMINCNVEKEP